MDIFLVSPKKRLPEKVEGRQGDRDAHQARTQHVPRCRGQYAEGREEVQMPQQQRDDAQVVHHEEGPEEGGSPEDLGHPERVSEGGQ